MHLDLKPENMMYFNGPNGEMVLKAIDFGFSELLGTRHGPENRANQCQAIHDVVGTREYTSPEIRFKHSDKSWEKSAEILSNKNPLKVDNILLPSPEGIQTMHLFYGKNIKLFLMFRS
jgi:serine/threonine protein kinase